MEGIVRILDHFRFFDGRQEDGGGNTLVETGNAASHILPERTHNGFRRLIEIADGGAFAQELRVVGQRESRTFFLAAVRLENRKKLRACRAGKQCTADHNRVRLGFFSQRPADL